MKSLGAFDVRKVKRAAAKEREKEEYFSKLKEGNRLLGQKTGEKGIDYRIGR